MNVATLLRADIFSYPNVGSIKQREEIVSRLLEMKNSGISDINSLTNNENCWRLNNPVQDCTWLNDAVATIIHDAMKFYTEIPYSKIPIWDKDKSKFNIKSWANINEKYSRNVYHSHKSSMFSCVYYLQGTDTGNLILTNPANILNDCSDFSPFTRDFLFKPKDGDLILWPSWIPHEVEMNLSDRQRINLVFDITLDTYPKYEKY